jgi:energy-coupling factor transporter ATP-binding protein EcfA2
MSKIKIKNFGPVKDGCLENDGWLDIKKVTVFVGNQGSGKSTVAKLISTFSWIEKALVRGDFDKKWFERSSRLKNPLLSYHRLENYFYPNTDIEYQGDAYSIKYKNGLMSINKTTNETYPLPQIMYVPAERNFLTYIKGAKELKLSSEALQVFNTEYGKAKEDMKGMVRLPINDVDVEYNKQYDNLYLKGSDYKIEISEAASGFQSFIPLYLVSNYLANSVKKQSENKEPMSSDELNRFKKGVQEIWSNDTLTYEQIRIALSTLSAKFNKTAFINIVEEPEQNLFPSSQWQMLQSLLEFNNMNEGNKLVLTTHSPYLVNFLNIAIQGKDLKSKIGLKNDLLKELYDVVSEGSLISFDEVAVYQLDENTGTITRLKSSYGILSDRNYLNDMLREGNQKFDKLLEIEEKLRI